MPPGYETFSVATAAANTAGVGRRDRPYWEYTYGSLYPFPIGPVTLLSGTTVPIGDALVRTLLIALYIVVSLLGMCAIGLFLSTLTDVPVGSMAATVVLAVVSQVLDQLPQLEAIHPWLFSHYWLGFADLLRDPIAWDSFANNAVLQAGYIAVFGALAAGRFLTKDILS